MVNRAVLTKIDQKKISGILVKNEMSKNKFAAKTTSREIGAHENTLGNYIRGKVPDQWVYLAKLHEKGIDIRYVIFFLLQ